MQRSSEVKVGMLLLTGILVVAVGVLLIGQEQNVFRPKNEYSILFETVSGLSTGNPVQLDGVEVGSVDRVILPQDPAVSEIEVWVTIDERYAQRVRADSVARIKTLGLLGDKYVEITSGSPSAPLIPDEGHIPAAPATSVDALMASGEDVMDNVTAITFSLRNILERMERGEGLMGKLITDSPTNERITESLVETLEAAERVVKSVEQGDGPLPRLLHDEQLTARLETTLANLEQLTTTMQEGDGLLPSLLSDPAIKERFDGLLTRLETTTANLEELSGQMTEGDGLLPRLLGDEQLADQVSRDLEQMLENLREVSEKLNEGEGTAAKLINDPQLYESIDDILIGINESWMLRWLIRNRQKAGIEARYEDAQEGAPPEQPTPPEQPPTEESEEPPPAVDPPAGEPPDDGGEEEVRGEL